MRGGGPGRGWGQVPLKTEPAEGCRQQEDAPVSTHRGCSSPEAPAGQGPSPRGARTSCTAWRRDCSPSRICSTCSDSSITACRSLSSVSVFLTSLGPRGTVSRPFSGPGEGLLLHSGPDCLTRKENLGWSEPQPSSIPSTTLRTQAPGQQISQQTDTAVFCFTGQDAPLSTEATRAGARPGAWGPKRRVEHMVPFSLGACSF